MAVPRHGSRHCAFKFWAFVLIQCAEKRARLSQEEQFAYNELLGLSRRPGSRIVAEVVESAWCVRSVSKRSASCEEPRMFIIGTTS